MSIDEAIHAYTTLTENIFSSKNWTLGGYEDIDKIPRLYESMVSIIEDPMLINMVNEDGSKWCVASKFCDESTQTLTHYVFIASSPLCCQGMRRVQHSFAAGPMPTRIILQ